MEMLYTIAQENISVYIILTILLIFIRKNISPTPAPTPIPITIDPVTQKLKQDILALQNKIAQMETEAEWRSEVRSKGQASVQSYRSEYPDKIETLWVEFTAIFDERRKREKRSPTQMYN
ncbi:hypothetical protein Glove_168g84 [Diversispora epigaea]|uniref:Uncharacterized protein n=1 Tax=Diversispora epigaea TaxID=1348612 RepID=A0A397IY63_9GLOM|nr:hypothetical protein Glove_168g84 [Diversispora epigaea]